MNKETYMNSLREALAPYNEELRNEILEDYENHFIEGAELGRSEEEVAAELGSIEDLMNELGEFLPKQEACSEEVKASEISEDTPVDAVSVEEIPAEETTVEKIQDAPEVIEIPEDSSEEKTQETKSDDLKDDLTRAAEAAGRKAADIVKQFANSIGSFVDSLSNQPTKKAEAPVQEEMNSFASDNSFSAENIHNLHLETDFGDIRVASSEDELVHVEYHSNGTTAQQMTSRFEYHIDDASETVYVNVKRFEGMSGFFKNLTNPSLELYVYLPANFGELYIKTLAGDVRFEDINAALTDITSKAGDIKLRHCDITTERINTAAGNISLKDNDAVSINCRTAAGNIKINGTAAFIEANSSAGNINLSCYELESIIAGSAAGNINIDLDEVPGYIADVKTSVGNMKLGFNGGDFKPKKSGVYTMGNPGENALKIQAKCSAGNVTINASSK